MPTRIKSKNDKLVIWSSDSAFVIQHPEMDDDVIITKKNGHPESVRVLEYFRVYN